jgi:HEAT repeat protein
MSTGGALVFWIAGGLLAAVGLVLVCLAIFADRPRGRRRCPRCWYDMSHTEGLVCSECGRHARRERRLHRTRRHRRVAALGMLLLLLGVSGAAYPTVKAHGWQNYAPTMVLIIAAPFADTAPHPVIEELNERLWGATDRWELMAAKWQDDAGRLPGWQQYLLARACSRMLAADAPKASRRFAFDALEANPAYAKRVVPQLIEILRGEDESEQGDACSLIEKIGPDAGGAVPVLIDILEQSGDSETRSFSSAATAAMSALGAIGPAAAPATAALTNELSGLDARPAAEALGQIGPGAAAALPALVELSGSGDARLRSAVADAISCIGATTPQAQDALISLLRDDEVTVRERASAGIVRHGALHKRVVIDLASDLESDAVAERVTAARGLLALSPEIDEALPVLQAALNDEQPLVRAFAVTASGRAAAARVADDLRPLLEDDDPLVRFAVRRALSTLTDEEGTP